MPQGLDKSMILNKILYAGEPPYQEMEVALKDTIAPGRLLVKYGNQWECTIATAASQGVIGVADLRSDQKLTSCQTAPSSAGTPTLYTTSGDTIRVIRGDVVVKLLGKSGQTIVVGTKVESAAGGMIQAITLSGDSTVGYSLENATTRLAANCDWVLVKLTI